MVSLLDGLVFGSSDSTAFREWVVDSQFYRIFRTKIPTINIPIFTTENYRKLHVVICTEGVHLVSEMDTGVIGL